MYFNFQNMNKEQYRKELIEELGIHFENEYSLPPLAARIFASLVLTDEIGLTFEECLLKRGASKSSISTSINLLLQLGMIKYFTKAGDRKRYFKIADKNTFFIKKLEQALKKVQNESKMIQKVVAYNETYNPDKYVANKEKTKIYMDCLKKNQNAFEVTIEKLSKLEQ